MQFVLNQHKFPKVILKYRIIRTRLFLLHLDDEIVERIEDSLSLFCVSNTRGRIKGKSYDPFCLWKAERHTRFCTFHRVYCANGQTTVLFFLFIT